MKMLSPRYQAKPNLKAGTSALLAAPHREEKRSAGKSGGSTSGIYGLDHLIRQAQPGQVRFIRLGRRGVWANDAIETGTLPFDYRPVAHDACDAGDWESVRRQIHEKVFSDKRSITRGLHELREFYELPVDTLWVTMANGLFWWAFAEPTVLVATADTAVDPPRYRKTVSGWSSETLAGEPLLANLLSSALTKTANHRMTICQIEHAEYLLRRIRGDEDPFQKAAAALQTEMSDLARKMVDRLDWRDFETLVDLIFLRGGWHRISQLGKGEADVDLILTQPIIGETAWVQVKSETDQAELNDNYDRFVRNDKFQHFFFIFHKASGPISLVSRQTETNRKIHIWTGADVAKATITAGLFDWLKQHV